jgi:hypothetical protein
MPDDDRASAALHNFITELNEAWEAAGPPSYAEFERLSARFNGPEQAPRQRVRVLAASTTHDILTGKRRTLPQWEWVASFVAVLRVVAIRTGLDPGVVGTVAEWKTKYQAARAMRQGFRPPLPAPATPYDPTNIDQTRADDRSYGHADDDGDNRGAPCRQSTDPGSAGPPPQIASSPADGHPAKPGEDTLPPELILTSRRCMNAYGRTGMRLLRRFEADEDVGEPA